MVPKATRIAFLGTRTGWNSEQIETVRTAAARMGLVMVLVEVHLPSIQAALDILARARPDAVFVENFPPLFVHRKQIADAAATLRVPDFHVWPQAVEDGALASYGHDAYDAFRRAAGYVDRILRGAKAGDLLVEQIERYPLVINLKTAKALRLAVPPTVLLRTDRIID